MLDDVTFIGKVTVNRLETDSRELFATSWRLDGVGGWMGGCDWNSTYSIGWMSFLELMYDMVTLICVLECFFYKKIIRFIWKGEKVREKSVWERVGKRKEKMKKERIFHVLPSTSPLCLTHDCQGWIRLKSGTCLESGSFTWVQGPDALLHCLLPPRVLVSLKLELEVEMGVKPKHWKLAYRCTMW